jgi:hypothetical protein
VVRRKYRRNRSAGRAFFRSQRRRTAGGEATMSLVAGSAIYGAIRQKASDMLAPVTAKLPLGNISDEVVLGTAGYLLAKKTSGLPRQIGKAALVIEAARVGEAIMTGQVGLGGNASTTTANYG